MTPSCTQATLPNLARRSRSWIKKRRKIRTPRYCAYRTKREANKGRTKATLKATHKKERHIPSGYPMDTIWMPSGYRGHMRKACGEHAEGMRSALPIDANSNAPFSAPHGARRWWHYPLPGKSESATASRRNFFCVRGMVRGRVKALTAFML